MKKLLFEAPNSGRLIFLLAVLVSLALHMHVFKLDLIGYHVWRQTQTQTVINNFFEEDRHIFNSHFNNNAHTDRTVRMEFPLMQWLVAQFFFIFGKSVMLTRILMFMIGICSAAGMFVLLQKMFSNSMVAGIGAWCSTFSPLFYYYTVNPLPDNLSLCCGIWSCALFYLWIDQKNNKMLVLSAMLISVAALCKLPFIIYAAFPLAYIIHEIKKDFKNGIRQTEHAIFYFFIAFVPVILWYVSVIPAWGTGGIVSGVFKSTDDVTRTLDLLRHHLISTLPELLLNYASLPFFLSGLFFIRKNKTNTHTQFYLFAIWGLAVLAYFLYELNMIGRVHDYYLMPFLPLLFILVTYGIKNLLLMKHKAAHLFVVFACSIMPLTAWLRADTRWNTETPGFNPDYYMYKDEIQKAVPKDKKIIIGEDGSGFILLYYADKKGWTYNEYTDTNMYRKWMYYGAEYFYTDSQNDTLEPMKRYIDKNVFEKGSIKIYSLKKLE